VVHDSLSGVISRGGDHWENVSIPMADVAGLENQVPDAARTAGNVAAYLLAAVALSLIIAAFWHPCFGYCPR
jgi:hypothetical protein